MVNTDKTRKTVRRSIVSLRRRQAWITSLLGVAILVSGVGIGFGSAMAYLSGPNEVETADTPPPPIKLARNITEKMAKKCGLDTSQKDKVREIMTSRIKSIHEIRCKAMDEIVVIHSQIADDMKTLMTPDQFAQWKKHNEEVRKRSRFRHHPRGHRSQRGDRKGRGGPQGSGRYRSFGSEMFKRLDKDGNGVLTGDEIKQAPERSRQFILKADKNGDGKVDRKEFESKSRRRRSPSPDGKMRRPRSRPGPEPETAPGTGLSMLDF